MATALNAGPRTDFEPMRFLMVCMQFPTGPGQSYMTTELADALVQTGHEVEVLFLDWSAAPGDETEVFSSERGVRVVRCTPRAVAGFGNLFRNGSKFLLSARHVAEVAREQFELEQFDAVIAWMPAIAIAPLVSMFPTAGIHHRLLFIWDFFPNHHREIGRIPGGPPYWLARTWERRLVRQFTAIICTLPKNAEYLRQHYPISPQQRVLVTPIWSVTSPLPKIDRAAIRSQYGLPQDRPIGVFGGQLVAGRGFEQMLAAADGGLATSSPLLYLLLGEGALAPMIRERAQQQSNVHWLPPLSRKDYLELLGACDVGMVATVPGVTSWSIPTKMIDYLRAGLPMVAALEPGSDVVSILDRYGVGAAVPFDEPELFHREAERLATTPSVREQARSAAPRCLDEVFDVRHAVATVLEAARPGPARQKSR